MSAQNLPNVSLVFWNLDVKTPPHLDAVRAALTENGLDQTRAAEIPSTTAFQRAASATKSKTIEAKTFTSKESGRPRCQIEELTEQDGRLRRSFIGQWELDETTDTPRIIAGTPSDDFRASFENAKTHYAGADISKVIQNILTKDGLGAYSPRKNGGVYFVPVAPTAADLLQKIERFADALSVRFLVYAVPDTSSQREEIADAIAAHFLDSIAAHANAIAGYNAETRPGIIENRRAAIQQTDTDMAKLRPLMNGRFATCRDEMRRLLARLSELDAAIVAETERQANAERERIAAEERAAQEAQDNARVEGRRQIVNV